MGENLLILVIHHVILSTPKSTATSFSCLSIRLSDI